MYMITSRLATRMTIQTRSSTIRNRGNPPGGSLDDPLWGSLDEFTREGAVFV